MARSVVARWIARLAVCFVVALVSIIVTVFWTALQQRPAVPLTAGLSGPWAAVNDEFDKRVKASFPIGSSVEQMGANLERQGFSRRDWGSAIDQQHEAMRREDNFVCNRAAYVHWRADSEGHLITVGGTYREEGCL